MKKFQIKKYLWQIVTLVLMMGVLFGFAAQKEGYHMDEVLSYQLANSEYNPFIITNKPVGRLAKYMAQDGHNLFTAAWDVVKNGTSGELGQTVADSYPEAVWFQRDQFVDYMTVNENDGFNPVSAYLGAQADTHPPLYYMALHTMCALVPGSASPMIACTLNILILVGIGILLMKLAALLEEKNIIPAGWGKPLGIMAALLYGLSSGGISTMLLARMYGLTALFAVWSFYLQIKMFYGGGFGKKRFLLALVTAAGFLSQYFFVFYCIPLALVMVIVLITKKRYKDMINYVCTMIGAGILGVGLFPFCIPDLFSSTMGNSVTGGFALNWERFSDAVFNMGRIGMEGFFGNFRVGIVLILLSLVVSVAAEVAKRSNSLNKVTESEGVHAEEENVSAEETPNVMPDKVSFHRLLFAPVILGFLLISNMTIYWMPRYLMPLFPFMGFALAWGLMDSFHFCKGKWKYLAFVPVAVFCLFSIFTFKDLSMYKGYDRQLQIAKEYEDYSCICFNDYVRYYENVPEFMAYENTLITYLYDFEIRQDKEQLNALEEVVVIRKSEVEEARMCKAMEDNGFTLKETLLKSTDSPWADTIYLWTK